MLLPFFDKRSGENAEMSFVDHLEELRWHIVRSLFAVLLMAIFIFIFQDFVFDVKGCGISLNRSGSLSSEVIIDFTKDIANNDDGKDEKYKFSF